MRSAYELHDVYPARGKNCAKSGCWPAVVIRERPQTNKYVTESRQAPVVYSRNFFNRGEFFDNLQCNNFYNVSQQSLDERPRLSHGTFRTESLSRQTRNIGFSCHHGCEVSSSCLRGLGIVARSKHSSLCRPNTFTARLPDSTVEV